MLLCSACLTVPYFTSYSDFDFSGLSRAPLHCSFCCFSDHCGAAFPPPHSSRFQTHRAQSQKLPFLPSVLASVRMEFRSQELGVLGVHTDRGLCLLVFILHNYECPQIPPVLLGTSEYSLPFLLLVRSRLLHARHHLPSPRV